MEKRLTQKEVKGWYKNIISIGYCNAQYLLQGLNREGWTCGVYGWNADIYEINYNTCIVTGYRPFGNVDNNYKLLKEYEQKAEKIYYNNKMRYDTKIKKIENIRSEYIKNILKMEE